MFIDYYAILEVSETATYAEIKEAFKQQALKWHPDRNLHQNTTIRMQQINEAFLILKDDEARSRYDVEYQRYKSYQKQKEDFYQQQEEARKYASSSNCQKEPKHEYEEYQVNDDVLNNWMNNAKKQSVDLAKQVIAEFSGMIKDSAKAVGKEAINSFGCLLKMLAIGIIIMIIVGIINMISKNHTVNPSISTPIKSETLKLNPTEIPIDTFENENSYKRYMIEDVGYISIPNNMELQSGKYKEFVERGQKQFARKMHYFVSDDRIVFQQSGLNKLQEEGFSLYARIIIETTFGYFDDYLKQTDDFSIMPNELSELNTLIRKEVTDGFKGSGLRIVKWEKVSFVELNNFTAVKTSYIRQLNENPIVYVENYMFHNYDRVHTLTLSYREQDSLIWKSLFSKVINSFHLTNIK